MDSEERAIVARILAALVDKGPRPDAHDYIRAQHRREWPVLHKALDDLEAWFKRGSV